MVSTPFSKQCVIVMSWNLQKEGQLLLVVLAVGGWSCLLLPGCVIAFTPLPTQAPCYDKAMAIHYPPTLFPSAFPPSQPQVGTSARRVACFQKGVRSSCSGCVSEAKAKKGKQPAAPPRSRDSHTLQCCHDTHDKERLQEGTRGCGCVSANAVRVSERECCLLPGSRRQ